MLISLFGQLANAATSQLRSS